MAGDNGGSWWNPIDNITAQAGNLLSGAVTSLSSGTVQPNVAASQTAYEGANYYNPATGNMETYTNGQWVPGNGVLGDTTSGTYTGGTYDPQAAATSAQNAQNAAYYDQQIGNVNSGMGRLDNQATIGHQNVLDSYNNAYNTLLGQKQSADTSYQNQKNSSGQDNVLAKNNVNANVGYQANALQRLLGAHGSGSSSSSQFLAPYAAARMGAMDRSGIDRTFANNNQALDQNYGDFGLNYNKSQKDLSHQLEVNNNSVDSGIAGTRASFLQQLAGLNSQKALAGGKSYTDAIGAAQPYVDQSNALLGQVDNLGKQYATPVQVGATPQYTAPTLDSYAQPTRQAVGVQQNAATDTTNPYTNLLFGNNKDKLANKLSF